MLDLSDGLASDIRHLTARSGAGARIRSEALPISPAAHAAGLALGADPTQWALHGGEDYELLFTVAATELDQVQGLLRRMGVPMTVVGEIVSEGLRLQAADGGDEVLASRGFAHFSLVADEN